MIDLANVSFLLPLTLLNKFIFSRLLKRSFYLSLTDGIDCTLFCLVAFWVDKFEIYASEELDFPLLGDKVDNVAEVKLMRRIIFDIRGDIFRMDYLLASITALLWFRCIILLRLTDYFGPLIEMIFAMILIFSRFILLYVLGLLTFSSIAALTLTTNPHFADIFQALRTFLEASLGDFDLH